MTKPTAPNPVPLPKYVKYPTDKVVISKPEHHYIRTFFSSLFGIIALNLVILSILVVWLNRTVTDTNTYVKTVTPLVDQPDIQNFLAAQATDNLLKNAPPAEVAAALLPAPDVKAKTAEQQAAEVKKIVNDSVLQIVDSPSFENVWISSNLSAHSGLVRQIDAGSKTLTLDLSPLVTGVVSELKETKLAPVSDQIDLPQDAGKLKLQGEGIAKFQDYYKKFKAGTWALVGITLVCITLCVWLSVHHARTARRILFGTGLSSLLLAAVISAPSFITLSGLDPVQRKAAVAFAEVLFRNLQVACIILGVVCILLAVGSKVFSKLRRS